MSDVLPLSAKLNSLPIGHLQQSARLKKRCLELMDPPLCIPEFFSSVKPIQILPMLRHWGNIKMWHDIAIFCMMGVH